MASETVLVTGGAGFIGSHLVDKLLESGYQVRVFDSLEPQVHGNLREQNRWPDYCNPGAEYILGDVRDRDALQRALVGADAVFHFAAIVGVGQSMYDVKRYVDVNVHGTATLLDVLANDATLRSRIRRLVLASSMSVYGEGAYECPLHGRVYPTLRSVERLKNKDWESYCPVLLDDGSPCDQALTSLPTDESKPLYPTSVYASGKKSQEELCIVLGQAYNFPTVALRLFNTYGTRQALSNPYTGVLAIFSARLLNNKPPLIFEDGCQIRDFIHISDIVQAFMIVLNHPGAVGRVLNVASGRQITVREIATILAQQHGGGPASQLVNEMRAGDVRHCYADIAQIRALGFASAVPLETGLAELTEWVRQQTASDNHEQALVELAQHGL